MLAGVVSDTHNNIKNITQIISIFNDRNVDFVVHTGDITNANSLSKFSALNCELFAVYGNNDRNEIGLDAIASKCKFKIQNPPFEIEKGNRRIGIFHEPDSIEDYLDHNRNLDIILHGHTHRYRNEVINKTLVFNPGESAGFQKGKNAIAIINLKTLTVERIYF
mgnify:FL=1|tara:strand:+ start:6526 stop:7017 length:492 start_codon:yes stop_codon:yes gene_type:complete